MVYCRIFPLPLFGIFIDRKVAFVLQVQIQTNNCSKSKIIEFHSLRNLRYTTLNAFSKLRLSIRLNQQQWRKGKIRGRMKYFRTFLSGDLHITVF